jgi:hypothetical protein
MKVLRATGRLVAIALGAGAMLMLSACAHKDLTAPCMAQSRWGSAFAADEPGCGPMRPIN